MYFPDLNIHSCTSSHTIFGTFYSLGSVLHRRQAISVFFLLYKVYLVKAGITLCRVLCARNTHVAHMQHLHTRSNILVQMHNACVHVHTCLHNHGIRFSYFASVLILIRLLLKQTIDPYMIDRCRSGPVL